MQLYLNTLEKMENPILLFSFFIFIFCLLSVFNHEGDKWVATKGNPECSPGVGEYMLYKLYSSSQCIVCEEWYVRNLPRGES